jgi:hypothetical protein
MEVRAHTRVAGRDNRPELAARGLNAASVWVQPRFNAPMTASPANTARLPVATKVGVLTIAARRGFEKRQPHDGAPVARCLLGRVSVKGEVCDICGLPLWR